MSCDKEVTLETFTPGLSSTSYLVTVGPGTMLVTSASVIKTDLSELMSLNVVTSLQHHQ